MTKPTRAVPRLCSALGLGVLLTSSAFISCTGGGGGGGGAGGGGAGPGRTVDDFGIDKTEAGNFRTGAKTWDKTDLTWGLENSSGLTGLTSGQVEEALGIATKLWADNSALTITRADDPAAADLRIRFAVGEHGDGEDNAFDGEGGVLGHAFFPGSTYAGQSIAGELHLDDEEPFTGDLAQAADAIDLAFVLTHEMGHNLGLVHSNRPNAIMAPSYKPWTERALHSDDIERVQELYGSPDGSVAPDRKRTPEFDPDQDPTELPGETDAQDDFDGDGLSRSFERYYVGTDPFAADTDGDGFHDGIEVALGTNPLDPDTDGDGVEDFEEMQIPRSDPFDPCDPNACQAGSTGDRDGDGLSNAIEERFGTDPDVADTDADLLGDYQELGYGTNPLDPDTDGDGCQDGQDDYPLNSSYGCGSSGSQTASDSDGDGLYNAEELVLGTDPDNADTDGDELTDFWEVAWWFSDALDACDPFPGPTCDSIGTNGWIGTIGIVITNGLATNGLGTGGFGTNGSWTTDGFFGTNGFSTGGFGTDGLFP